MERKNMSPHHQDVYKRLANLPRKILKHFEGAPITDLVLHELCGEQGFNLAKAAYFIDNPDFDCLKGVAGFDKSEGHNGLDHWAHIENFNKHLKGCNFNTRVRSVIKPSKAKATGSLSHTLISDLAAELGMTNPGVYTWDAKHDNHGIFLFQKNNDHTELTEEILAGLCLLAFCPL
jgi:hypothetical protein